MTRRSLEGKGFCFVSSQTSCTLENDTALAIIVAVMQENFEKLEDSQRQSVASGKVKLRVMVSSSSLQLVKELRRISNCSSKYELELRGCKDLAHVAQSLANNAYDIFIVDDQIGSERGLDMIRAARASYCTAPIVFAALNGRTYFREAVLRAGATEYLEPSDLGAPILERCILDAMERQRILSEDRHRTRLHESLTEISTNFIGVPPEGIDDAIKLALERFVELSALEAGYVLQLKAERSGLEATHGWTRLESDLPASSIDAALHEELRDIVSHRRCVRALNHESLAEYPALRKLVGGTSPKVSVIVCDLSSYKERIGYLLLLGAAPPQAMLALTLSVVPLFVQLLANVIERHHEYVARRRAEEAFRTILEGTVAKTAENFFRSLVRQLALVLNAKFAFIAKRAEISEDRMTTLAVWAGEDYGINETYELSGSASEEILRSSFVEVRENAALRYPKDAVLQREKINSYMGTKLLDAAGIPIGVLAVFDVNPLPEWAPRRYILEIFAARAGAELERLAAEEESTRLHRQLMQAQKMEAIGQLASGVAHDLNNSLFAVAGHLQLIDMESGHSERMRHSVNCALKGCERANSLISQLLCFSRQGKYNIEGLHLPQVVSSTIDFLARIIGKDIEIIHNCPARQSAIQGDRAQLEQVITNLILNSKQAMPLGGKIEIAYVERFINAPHRFNLKAQRGNFICLTIVDNGGGISEENLERIFEPFFTTKDVGIGSGLGLAMVYGIMQNHGGWIEASSLVGKGSVFSLYFPCHEGRMEQNKTVKAGKESATTKGNILIIDDEAVLVELMQTFLERAGFSTSGFTSGADAIDWYRTNSSNVDLVILDMKMPEMSGTECFNRLREIKPDAQVIILSGYIQDASAQLLLKEGALRFLQKPVRYDELIQIINDYLRQSLQAAN